MLCPSTSTFMVGALGFSFPNRVLCQAESAGRFSGEGQGDQEAAPERPPLTEREQQVLQGVFEGLANKEIGVRLGVSESAVKSTLQQLFRKTRVRTRSQLVRVALEGSFATPRK